MNRKSFRLLASLSLPLLVVSCQEKAEPPPAKVEVAAPAPVDPSVCVGAIAAGTVEKLNINGTDWELNGSTLTQVSPAKGDKLVVGVVSDIKEDSAENIANLKAFVAWYQKVGAELLLVAGDTGEEPQQIENAVAVLAEAKVPVLVISGNREGRKSYQTALDNLRKKYPNVFNLNVVRRVDLPLLDVLSMPGYFNRDYIHAADGCQYTEADVQSVTTLAKASNSPMLLVSHGGPKQEGPNGIDRTSEGANVGDPAITKAIADNKIAFGVFGNIHEAGGHATDLAGKTAIKPGEVVDALYMHPGAADAVNWAMNDGSESIGMAGLLTIGKDGKAKYEINRIEDPAKKPVAKAKKKG